MDPEKAAVFLMVTPWAPRTKMSAAERVWGARGRGGEGGHGVGGGQGKSCHCPGIQLVL